MIISESISELTKPPLYVLSCGELGYITHRVEQCLSLHLNLAKRWDAMVLIDEADVFLAERTVEDLTRAELVTGSPILLCCPQRYRSLLTSFNSVTSNTGKFCEYHGPC